MHSDKRGKSPLGARMREQGQRILLQVPRGSFFVGLLIVAFFGAAVVGAMPPKAEVFEPLDEVMLVWLLPVVTVLGIVLCGTEAWTRWGSRSTPWRRRLLRPLTIGLAITVITLPAGIVGVWIGDWPFHVASRYVILWTVAASPIIYTVYFTRRLWAARTPPSGLARGLLVFGALHIFSEIWVVALWHSGSSHPFLSAAMVIAVMTGAGILALLQVWESVDRGVAAFADVSALAGKEAEWLNLRRGACGLPSVETEDGRSPDTVGLALSGGGIRAATVSLGFLRELARSRRGPQHLSVLHHIDYLSTVSGSGWTAGALTSRTAATKAANVPFNADSDEDWDRLTSTLRDRCDYLVPGGVGLTPGTFEPIAVWLVGLILNAAAFVFFGAAIVGLLQNSHNRGGLLVRALDGLKRQFPRLVELLFLPPGDALGQDLSTLNVVPALFAISVLVFAVGVTFRFSLYLASHAYKPVGIRMRSVDLFGSLVASYGLLFSFLLGIATLAIHRHPLLTLVGLALLAMGALALSERFKGSQLMAIGSSVVLAGIGLLQLDSLASLRHWIDLATSAWGNVIYKALHVPGRAMTTWSDGTLPVAGIVSAIFIGLSYAIDRNYTSLHRLWEARIRAAYLAGLPDDPCDWRISDLQPSAAKDQSPASGGRNAGGPHARWPLPIVNAALNTPGSDNVRHRTRGTCHFEFSPYFVGSRATGWAPAESFAEELTLARATAISAAAVNSQGGAAIPKFLRAIFTILDLGLGVWVRNPMLAGKDVRFRRWPHFWTAYSWREVFGKNSERDALVFLSDGGHHDNLGVFALVERRCKLVICLDAGSDPDWTSSDLAHVSRMLRVDAGWKLSIDLTPTRPKKPHGSIKERRPASPVAVGKLTRRSADGRQEELMLVYVKAGLVEGLPYDVENYARRQPDFPQETTAKQFFSEAQFEAYRILGERLAQEAVRVIESRNLLPASVVAGTSPAATAAAPDAPKVETQPSGAFETPSFQQRKPA